MQSERKRSERTAVRPGGGRARTSAGGSDRCMLSLGSRVRMPRNVPTFIYLQERTSQSRIHLVFGFGAPGWDV